MTNDHLPMLPPADRDGNLPSVYQGNPMQLVIPPQEEGIHLLDYWKIIRKRKWLIILCFIATMVTAFLYTMRETPLYRASATLLVELDVPNIQTVQ